MSEIHLIEKINGMAKMIKCKEFSPLYFISEYLVVYSYRNNKYNRIKINPVTLKVAYHNNGKVFHEKIYNIAARVFLNIDDKKNNIIFTDGNSENRHISNLSIKTSPDVKLDTITIKENVDGILKDVEIRKTHIKGYYVSAYSKVYSSKYFDKSGKLICLKTRKRKSGEEYLQICIDGKSVCKDVKFLVMKAFYPNEEELRYVLYRDNNSNNKHYSNLYWSANQEKEDENFKMLPGFSKYKFSSDGICKSYYKKEPYFITPQKGEDERFYYRLYDDTGIMRSMFRYRIIAIIFVPNPDNLPEVDHINRLKTDDRAENLRWVTSSENCSNKDPPTKKDNPIIQFDKEGNILNIFKGVDEAAAYLEEFLNININPRKLRDCANRNNDIIEIENMTESVGYIWKYKYIREVYVFKEGEISVPLIGNFVNKIVNFPSYRITNYGNIINKKGYKLKCAKISGYPRCTLQKKSISVHIHVALFFVQGRTEEKCYVNHKDENKSNFHYSNLEWVTQSENIKYSVYKSYKSVDQFDIKTGEYIRSFPSIKDAAIFIGKGGKGSSISLACKNHDSTAYGYIWRHTEDSTQLFAELPNYKVPGNIRSVDQFDLSGKFIKRYRSACEAGSLIGQDRSGIYRCCTGECSTAYGFIWRFSDLTKDIPMQIEVPELSKRGKKCVVNQYDLDGNFLRSYNSMTDAATTLNMHYSSISKCCNGKLKKAFGFLWAFA